MDVLQFVFGGAVGGVFILGVIFITSSLAGRLFGSSAWQPRPKSTVKPGDGLDRLERLDRRKK